MNVPEGTGKIQEKVSGTLGRRVISVGEFRMIKLLRWIKRNNCFW